MTRPFRISTGPSRLQTHIDRKKVSWAKLAKRLQKFDQIDIKYEDYLARPRDEQSNIKDVGYFIGGQFNSSSRVQEHMARRCCITLDIDHIDSWDIDALADAYEGLEYVVHSTLKHCKDSPRLRLVLPLSKDITPDKYEPVARKVAERLGMDCFDDTTFQPARIMFWPAVTIDGDIFKLHGRGSAVDPEKVLAEYDDWQDFGEWPHSSRVSRSRGPVKQAEWPLDKPGIIGAFCRTFDIHAAIVRFDLPYESTDHDNRYLPAGSTGAAGAVVYDDVFLYSNHESDVVGLQNVNAWDLVRMHRFGDTDANVSDDVRMMERPSSKEMVAMAMNIPEVHAELAADELHREQKSQPADKPIGEEPTNESTLSFDKLTQSISKLDADDSAGTDKILNNMAAARLDPYEADQLAGLLKTATGLSKTVTFKAIDARTQRLSRRTNDGLSRDLQRELIAAALEEHYAGGRHLKRIGKVCWRYQQGKWSIVTDEPVRGRVGQTFTRIKEQRPTDAMALVQAVEESSTSALVNQVTQLMLDTLAVKDDCDDPLRLMRSITLPIINCKNVQLQFNSKGAMRVRDHKPEDFYTIRIETDYDEDAACPQWDKFMQLVFSDTGDPDDMVRHFEELGGYIMQMSRWLKTWVMLHGPKDTGKSTAAMLLQEMLGSAFLTKAMSQAGRAGYDFEEQTIIGKLLMVDDDFPAGGSLPDGFMKKYSEEKPATANIKWGNAVNFRARCLPMLLTNHWPIVHDTTPAFLERALVMPFTHRIVGSQRNDQARAEMMRELPGILNRFVSGLRRLRKRGNWDIPLTCFEAAEEWAARANPFLAFVSECLVICGDGDEGGGRTGASDRIERGALYEAFLEWYGQQSGNKSNHSAMHRGLFYERMREKFGREYRSSGQFFFRGIRITDDAPLRVNELKVVSVGEEDSWDV